VDSTGATETNINLLCLEAESYINSATRYNWSDAYASLNVDVKYLLSETEACLVAIYLINYNMSGFTSRTEAELMLNILKIRLDECMDAIEDIKIQSFMLGA
jgi:hypothetical protein